MYNYFFIFKKYMVSCNNKLLTKMNREEMWWLLEMWWLFGDVVAFGDVVDFGDVVANLIFYYSRCVTKA